MIFYKEKNVLNSLKKFNKNCIFKENDKNVWKSRQYFFCNKKCYKTVLK